MTGIPLLRKNRLTKTIKTMKKLLLLLFAAALSLSASEPARAWGREGHETIAKIAERNLTKRAKKRIEKYLGGHSVVYYAKWMDEYRQTPEYAFTNDWHTAPVGADLRYGDELLKPGKGNAVYGLELAIRNLRDYRNLTDSAVAVNLKYVIHLVGDMHCPAHIKYTTHNTKYDVLFEDKYHKPHKYYVHHVWDNEIITTTRIWSVTEWAGELDRASKREKAAVQAGTPRDWLHDSAVTCEVQFEWAKPDERLGQDFLNKIRTLAKEMTDDIFNTYLRKRGTVNPYYSEYCDGKSVTCPGLKQWGTVTLANNGRSALQILRYYYGSDIEIVRTSNIQSIPQSYPGSPLRQGDSGTAVFTLQRQLNRIAKDYPFLGKLTVDGVFGSRMAATVRAFQKQFNLTADGVVGRQTWYKISYIYVSVKDLAELTSEGETSSGTLSDGTWGGTTLRTGSTGSAVEQLQFWLNTLAQYESAIPSVTVDGAYGTATANAVRAFQRKYGLTVDGVVGQTTWKELYDQFRSIQSDNGTPNAYPGTPLREGSSGQNVRLVQFWLKIARTVYTSLANVTVDGKFGAGTAAAVQRFQRYFGLTADGVVGRTTWQKLYEVYNDIANRLLSSSLRPGEYPGVLRTGSSGTAVRELQFYLYLMSAYESSIPPVSIDGKFGADTERAVRAYQRFAGLTVDGVVGRTTWNSLYGRASQLRSSGPVVTLKRLPYPGTPLTVGSSGSAVLYYTLLLQRIAYYFDSVENPPLSDQYTDETAAATRSAQQLLGLEQTGIADADTWTAVEALSLQLAAHAPNPDRDTPPSTAYPGRAIAEGSAGQEVGQVERWLNRRAQLSCGEDYVADNNRFGAADAAAVRAVQQQAGLLVTGIVNRETWAALQAQSCNCDKEE